MNGEQQEAVRRRRTRAEVRQLVVEFVNSSMRRSEFCQSRGFELQHAGSPSEEAAAEKEDEKRSRKGKLVGVELATKKPAAEQPASCGLAVKAMLRQRPCSAELPTLLFVVPVQRLRV
jgi:hypothetical protein